MSGVLLVDDDPDLLDAIGEWVKVVKGKPCLAVRGLAELTRVGPRALECELAIVDINLGASAPTGIEVCAWLRAQRFAGRIVFLTGHGQADPLVQRACRLYKVPVLRKPIDSSDLGALVDGDSVARPPAGRRMHRAG
jgi:CheY-like chemotaxis protein